MAPVNLFFDALKYIFDNIDKKIIINKEFARIYKYILNHIDKDKLAILAVHDDNLNVIKRLFTNDELCDKIEIMFEAARFGKLDIIKHLHNIGMNMNAASNHAYKLAAGAGYTDILYYIDSQIDIKNKHPALISACYRCNLNSIKYLIEVANVELNNGWDFPLEIICEEGDIQILDYLSKNGADIHQINSFSIYRACSLGHVDMIKYLIDNGVKGIYGNSTCIRMAKLNNHHELINLLSA